MILDNDQSDYGFFCDLENHTPEKSFNKIPKNRKYFVPAKNNNCHRDDCFYGNSYESLDALDYINSEEYKQEVDKNQKTQKEFTEENSNFIRSKIYVYMFVSFTALCYVTIIFF
tara:strand:+ start:288 stop:629 length:342 start_codon:yes stop_codon:yes gene_type:complete